MNLLKLSDYTGEPLYLVVHQIVAIKAEKAHNFATKIWVCDGGFFAVKEDADTIAEQLGKLPN